MSGPRVTSGEGSKQDYETPADLISSIERRFGEIQFDLAAHRGNKKHRRYFAPQEFVEKFDPDKTNSQSLIESLVRRGAHLGEARAAVERAEAMGRETVIKVKNHDTEAHALDAFKYDWAPLSNQFHDRRHGDLPGLLWLNCEFGDVPPWARRCLEEGQRGANIVLLTPAMVGSNWYRDLIASRANVYLLNGRVMFDGKNVFPKDCMVSHFWPGASGMKFVWNWKNDEIVHAWRTTRLPGPSAYRS